MADFVLSPSVFAIISALIEQRAGVHHAQSDREILASKVTMRAQERGFDTALDYYYFLRYDDVDGTELDRLVESVLVHETFFFRESTALEVLIDEFVAPRVAASAERLTLWCAACSTGEEPLTVAMMLAQRGILDRVRIVATDISAAVLARARTGRFPRRSVRTEPLPAAAAPWLTRRTDDEGWLADPALVRAIEWRQANLVDAKSVAELPPAQAIICRNILFYFRDEIARTVVDNVAGRLADDGVIIVGVAESLLRLGTALVCEEHGGAFVYRRRPGAPSTPEAHVVAPAPHPTTTTPNAAKLVAEILRAGREP